MYIKIWVKGMINEIEEIEIVEMVKKIKDRGK